MSRTDSASRLVDVGGLPLNMRRVLCEEISGFTPDIKTPHGRRLERHLGAVAAALEEPPIGESPTREDVRAVVYGLPDTIPYVEHLAALAGIDSRDSAAPVGLLNHQVALF